MKSLSRNLSMNLWLQIFWPFRPGSSGAQHWHKRARTSLAQRIAWMSTILCFAKTELCKANEGKTRTRANNSHRCAASTDIVQHVVSSKRPDQCGDALVANEVATKIKLRYQHR